SVRMWGDPRMRGASLPTGAGSNSTLAGESQEARFSTAFHHPEVHPCEQTVDSCGLPPKLAGKGGVLPPGEDLPGNFKRIDDLKKAATQALVALAQRRRAPADGADRRAPRSRRFGRGL